MIMDFTAEVLKLVEQIPKGYVSTPTELAISLGDLRARRAVLEVLKTNLDLSYKIVSSGIVNDRNQRNMLMKDGIRIDDKKISNLEKSKFKDFSSNYPLKRLREKQIKLSEKIMLVDDFKEPKRICGIDAAYSDNFAFCSLAVFDFRTMKLIESKTKKTRVSFPYVPTYLAFRELDAMKSLAENLDKEEDVLFVDGNGILHPRKFGLASHLGVKLNLISIGIAKSLLCGRLRRIPKKIGDSSEVVYEDEILAHGLKTSKSKRLIYISSGHRISPKTSLLITKKFTIKKTPEPLRAAHVNARKFKLADKKK